MKKFLFPLYFLFIYSSCNENNELFDPTLFGNEFKGITFTSANGPDILGGDRSDWCYPLGLDKDVIPGSLPQEFLLYPAYPNPVKSGDGIVLRFSIPELTEVNLCVINNKYQVVSVVINAPLNAGYYSTEFQTRGIDPGVYRVVFESGKNICTGDIWIKGRGER